MSVDTTMSGLEDSPPAPDEFITDRAGRTLFYPFGFSWSGYVVPDAARERMLRRAVERFQNTARRVRFWPLAVILPCFAAASMMLDSHPFWFLAAVVVPLALVIAVPRALLRYRIGSAINGLQQVSRRDNGPAYRRQVLLAGLALIWVTLQIYDSRLSALPAAPGTIVYYSDISETLVLVLLYGFIALALATTRHRLSARFGASSTMFGLLVFSVLTVCLVADAALNFINPAPSVTVSSDGLACGWRVGWADISSVGETTGGRGWAHDAVLTLRSEPQVSKWPAGNARRCRITGLNEDYETVLRTIRGAWLASLPAPTAAAESLTRWPTNP
jgi:uncharacterized membrane protein